MQEQPITEKTSRPLTRERILAIARDRNRDTQDNSAVNESQGKPVLTSLASELRKMVAGFVEMQRQATQAASAWQKQMDAAARATTDLLLATRAAADSLS